MLLATDRAERMGYGVRGKREEIGGRYGLGGGQRTVDRGQRSEIRGQVGRWAVRRWAVGQKTEIKDQRSAVREQPGVRGST
jgi:hypothetical protein